MILIGLKCHHKGPCKRRIREVSERRKYKDRSSGWSNLRPQAQECGRPLEAEKCKGTN